MARTFGCAVMCGAVLLGAAGSANAAPILSAVSATVEAGGPGDGFIEDTFDQSGLFGTYTSGVTDFDEFLGTKPIHTSNYYGYEWFSKEFETTAQVTFDLGASHYIDRLALWNEESSGIGVLDLSYSLDGINFFALAHDLKPADNESIGFDIQLIHTPDYGAEVFSFGVTNARFVRFNMSECGQGNDDYKACAIGEVAFAAAAVPEPGTMLLLGSGLAAIAARRRRQRP